MELVNSTPKRFDHRAKGTHHFSCFHLFLGRIPVSHAYERPILSLDEVDEPPHVAETLPAHLSCTP